MRTNYRNGDSIGLGCGCDGCSPSMINGVLCHEHGCSDAWRDYQIECDECGCDFYPEDRYQRICTGCTDDRDRDNDLRRADYEAEECYETAEDYGGAFDGFNVTSDADPGL